MTQLQVTVDDNGRATVSVGGVVVGLIKNFSLRLAADEVVPEIHVEMVKSPMECGGDSTLCKALEMYKGTLRLHPFIQLTE